MLRLATERAGGRPEICILPTASGDTSDQIGRFYAGLRRARLRPLRRLALPARAAPGRAARPPARTGPDLRRRRQPRQPARGLGAHELGEILSLAWRRGIVLAGQSAGATCWFEAGHHVVRPACRARAGPRPARRQPLRPLQQRARAPRRLPGRGRRRHAGRLRHRRLRRLCSGRGRPRPRPSPRSGAPGLPGQAGEEGVAESPLPARFLPAPAPAALREDIAEFRRITGMRKRAGWLG